MKKSPLCYKFRTLALGCILSGDQAFAAKPPVDPARNAHVAAGGIPSSSPASHAASIDQPEEGITLQMRATMPGPTLRTRAGTLDFDYAQFGKVAPTTGYEKLLYDCLMGDATLFHRADMVEAAWKVADPFLSTRASLPRDNLPTYAPGTWAPPEADQVLAGDGHWWTA